MTENMSFEDPNTVAEQRGSSRRVARLWDRSRYGSTWRRKCNYVLLLSIQSSNSALPLIIIGSIDTQCFRLEYRIPKKVHDRVSHMSPMHAIDFLDLQKYRQG